MDNLGQQITAQVKKSTALAERLAALPAEIAAAGPQQAKTLAAEWQTVRSDRDLSEAICRELKTQQHLAQRAELQTALDEQDERLSKCRIKNRQAVHDLEAILLKLRRHHNDPAKRSKANSVESEKEYLNLKEERGRVEGKVQLSASALRLATTHRDQAANDLALFDRDVSD